MLTVVGDQKPERERLFGLSDSQWRALEFIAPLIIAAVIGWFAAQTRVAALETKEQDHFAQMQQQMADFKSEALRELMDLKQEIRDLRSEGKR